MWALWCLSFFNSTSLCGGFYIGKTTHPFFKRIQDHIKPIHNCRMETAVSGHAGTYHNFKPNMIKFMALEHIPIHVRGGSDDKTLLQLEARWIYNLKATEYPGFNETLSFNPFYSPFICICFLLLSPLNCPHSGFYGHHSGYFSIYVFVFCFC